MSHFYLLPLFFHILNALLYDFISVLGLVRIIFHSELCLLPLYEEFSVVFDLCPNIYHLCRLIHLCASLSSIVPHMVKMVFKLALLSYPVHLVSSKLLLGYPNSLVLRRFCLKECHHLSLHLIFQLQPSFLSPLQFSDQLKFRLGIEVFTLKHI